MKTLLSTLRDPFRPLNRRRSQVFCAWGWASFGEVLGSQGPLGQAVIYIGPILGSEHATRAEIVISERGNIEGTIRTSMLSGYSCSSRFLASL
jgi:hypothetical protein